MLLNIYKKRVKYMKRIIIALLIFFMVVSAFAGQPMMSVIGDMNSWTDDAMSLQELGTSKWILTREYTGTTEDVRFKFRSGDDWARQWSNGTTINAETQYDWYPDGAPTTLDHTNGKYYTYIIKDVGYGFNSEGYVFETSATPVTISSVLQNPLITEVTPDDDVVVTVTVSANPSSEEDIFVRYTIDAWSTSSVVECSFTGTSGTATILKQLNAVAVQYYVFTTTIDAPNTTTDNIDLMTINYDNNGGSNYSYTSTDSATPITLASFTASAKKGNVDIAWTTASETENSHFLVYRGDLVIGRVVGNGTCTDPHNYIFIDDKVMPGVHEYAIEDVTYGGEAVMHNSISVEVEAKVEVEVADFVLNKAYPNPFNPSVSINYQLSTINEVRASIYDTNGNPVEELLNTEMSAGIHTLTWNASGMPSGVYVVTMQAGNSVQSQKIVLMK
jgi:hypothetical protein